VLLGDGVIVRVWVALGTDVDSDRIITAGLVGASALTGLQPVKIKNRNSHKAIPANTCIVVLFLPVNNSMFICDYLGTQL
jgi:hypothetical protein